MMKYFAIIAVLFASAAHADVTQLQPALPTARCAAESFSADGLTVNGACQVIAKCVTRGCHGVATTYAVTWALDGTPTLGAKRAASPAFVTDTAITLDGHAYYYVATSILGAIAVGTGYSALVWQP